MDIMLLKNKLAVEPKDMKPTHVLHRCFYGKYGMRLSIYRYPDSSFFVKAPIEISEVGIQSIDWSVNTFGYILTYPDGVQTGQSYDTPRDFNEANPFEYLLGSGE